MDAMTSLPRSAKDHDSIMVFHCRLTKMAHFVPFKEKGFGSPEQAEMFLQHIVRLHGIPLDIVSDRHPILTSPFWRDFLKLLGSKPNHTTAFHPQSNGGNERINQVVSQYLRIFTNDNKDDWSTTKLAQAEFVYNNSFHSSTGMSPFEANYGYHPRSPLDLRLPTNIPSVEDLHDKRLDLRSQLVDNLARAQANYKRFYDRHARDVPEHIALNKLVYLNARNIKQRHTGKLAQRLLGPFKIIAASESPLAWKLELPDTMRIHPYFHVSLLEPYVEGHPGQHQDPAPAVIVDGEPEYHVESILDSRLDPDDPDPSNPDNYQYLVKWLNFPATSNSWEPYENLHDVQAFRAFKRKHPRHLFPRPVRSRRR
jgi:hypothetical protein